MNLGFDTLIIYKSFIDIYSPGAFPEHVEPEQFIREQLKPIRRNPLITQTLYYSKDMESFATGLKRIHEACTAAGVEFEFVKEPYGFTVRFHRHCGDKWRQQEVSANHGTQSGTQSGTQINVDQINRILEMVRQNNKVTRKQMADDLSVGLRTVQRIINEIPNMKYVGSGSGGHWEIDE